MDAATLWAAFGAAGDYEAWSFGGDPDGLAALVLAGKKTATASAFPLYEAEGEPLPRAGEYSVILDSRDQALCVIRTTRVFVVPFRDVDRRQAWKEGEGDRSPEYWRQVHRDFFTRELAEAGLPFSEDMPVVCEEFELVYRA